MSDYGTAVTLETDYPTTVERTRAALAEQGFGVLTEIDVAATLKAKLDAELPPYLILGACNPPLAHQAIGIDASIGLLLPCNVVVRTVDERHTVVEALDPGVMVRLTGEPRLAEVADTARAKLTAALAALAGSEPAR